MYNPNNIRFEITEIEWIVIECDVHCLVEHEKVYLWNIVFACPSKDFKIIEHFDTQMLIIDIIFHYVLMRFQ